MFYSCVCQKSERVEIEENHMNFYFTKIYNIPKFIPSLEYPYVFSDLDIFQNIFIQKWRNWGLRIDGIYQSLDVV